ncbi:MAG: hypothetical protein MI785_20475 [Kiloniellales bacterium]|nr:hypothetical protein [Kiloniellales bacterium]
MTDTRDPDTVDPSALKIADLGQSERLVLWGLRYWVACYCKGESPWPLLSDVFRKNRAADAALSLDALLQLTSIATTRMLDMRCPACPSVSPDEVGFIDAFACAQRGDRLGAFRLLRSWLPAPASRLASEMVAGLARIFSDAGLVLPEPGRTRVVAEVAPGTESGGTVVTLH